MSRFVLAKAAARDILSIHRYLSREVSPETADRVVSAIHAEITKIAAYPGFGHERVDVANPRYRFWRAFRYLIAYRIDGQTLTIARVLHGSRDIGRHIR
jgi:plasmid stabilization system protein ParE